MRLALFFLGKLPNPLLLPVLYYLISTTVKDWIDDIRAEARKGGRR